MIHTETNTHFCTSAQMNFKEMDLKFLFKSCKTLCFLRDSGGFKQWVQKQRKIFSKGLKREAKNCQQRGVKRACFVLFVGCLSSQQHASVSQGRICTDNFTCCHTEIEAADQESTASLRDSIDEEGQKYMVAYCSAGYTENRDKQFYIES